MKQTKELNCSNFTRMMTKLIPKWEISSRKISNIVMSKKNGMTMKIKNEFFYDLFQLSLFFA